MRGRGHCVRLGIPNPQADLVLRRGEIQNPGDLRQSRTVRLLMRATPLPRSNCSAGLAQAVPTTRAGSDRLPFAHLSRAGTLRARLAWRSGTNSSIRPARRGVPRSLAEDVGIRHYGRHHWEIIIGLRDAQRRNTSCSSSWSSTKADQAARDGQTTEATVRGRQRRGRPNRHGQLVSWHGRAGRPKHGLPVFAWWMTMISEGAGVEAPLLGREMHGHNQPRCLVLALRPWHAAPKSHRTHISHSHYTGHSGFSVL